MYSPLCVLLATASLNKLSLLTIVYVFFPLLSFLYLVEQFSVLNFYFHFLFIILIPSNKGVKELTHKAKILPFPVYLCSVDSQFS